MEKESIFEARKCFLFSESQPWEKRNNPDFDVTMGAWDGAECCELVGLYMLDKLKILGLNIGLYRDDGLGVSNATNRQLENIKKQLCSIFKQEGLSITVEANMKEVNFLDVNLDLRTGLYKTFTKPNDTPLYIHKKSNHPPSIISCNKQKTIITISK